MLNANRSVLIAKLLCVVSFLGATANLVIVTWRDAGQQSVWDQVDKTVWGFLLPITFSSVAAFIIIRQPANRVGWLLMLPALVASIPLEQYLVEPRTAVTPTLWLLLWLDNWSWIPIIFPIFLIPLHFPSGRPPSSRWNWVNWLAVGLWLLFITITAFVEPIGPSNYDWRVSNPIGLYPITWLAGWFLVGWGIGLVTVLTGSVIALLVRYRRAAAVERGQIKWLLYVGAIFIFIYTAAIFQSDPDVWGAVTVFSILFSFSILAFPIAIGYAILRHRLYDIDIIIRKTLVYSLLSGLLALFYFGSVLLLQTLFGAFTDGQSPIIIVLSTLLIAALFAPLRRRIQAIIDRRFFRKKYNAQQVLAQFAKTARDEVDLERLTAAITDAIQETVQPTSVSVWFRPTRHQKRKGNVSSWPSSPPN